MGKDWDDFTVAVELYLLRVTCLKSIICFTMKHLSIHLDNTDYWSFQSFNGAMFQDESGGWPG